MLQTTFSYFSISLLIQTGFGRIADRTPFGVFGYAPADRAAAEYMSGGMGKRFALLKNARGICLWQNNTDIDFVCPADRILKQRTGQRRDLLRYTIGFGSESRSSACLA